MVFKVWRYLQQFFQDRPQRRMVFEGGGEVDRELWRWVTPRRRSEELDRSWVIRLSVERAGHRRLASARLDLPASGARVWIYIYRLCSSALGSGGEGNRPGMDPKAAAKSKRSQSQQGKRNHPTPSAVSARAQQKKKESLPQQQQPQHQGEQRSRRHLRGLPSNWDRYDDDETDVGQEGGSVQGLDDSGGPAAGPTMPLSAGGHVVARKSRGANFGFLIDQARSQIRDRDHGDGDLTSTYLFDEVMPGMLYAQKENWLPFLANSIA